jgi:hypothetical protein
MRRLVVPIACFIVFSTHLMAQSDMYFGIRAQGSMALARPAVPVSLTGGLGGGLGFAYIYLINKNWDMMADGTFSYYNLTANDVTVNFFAPEVAYSINKSFGEKQRFKLGAGIFLGGISTQTKYYDQFVYWGNAAKEAERYSVTESRFLSGFNYGLCVEPILNFDVFQLSVRYKYALANINTEGPAWRQGALEFGATYFFGAKDRGESKETYKPKKHDW